MEDNQPASFRLGKGFRGAGKYTAGEAGSLAPEGTQPMTAGMQFRLPARRQQVFMQSFARRQQYMHAYNLSHQ
jgi:hypothetical protein